MVDEIIKLIEYLSNNSFVQGAFIAYVIFAVIVIAVVVAIFAITIRQILKHRRMWK